MTGWGTRRLTHLCEYSVTEFIDMAHVHEFFAGIDRYSNPPTARTIEEWVVRDVLLEALEWEDFGVTMKALEHALVVITVSQQYVLRQPAPQLLLRTRDDIRFKQLEERLDKIEARLDKTAQPGNGFLFVIGGQESARCTIELPEAPMARLRLSLVGTKVVS